ncbi:MAG: UDP-N-acetylmuramoyl-tripeptide--D-alanyl-D-alanine ligase [Lachnospiraceae bacterium]|nr:UDP-N-acetylmuramoyl-tripeptide--D-alanyl-D-alanine ligase [Lachnospiraceae bacterium]
MINMTIEAVADACGGEIVCDPKTLDAIRHVEAMGVVTDNRKVKEKFVFIPIVGKRVDGHSFIDQAFKDGALFVLSERRPESCDGPYVLVEHSEDALKRIAAYYRRQLSIPIIGVVGSVGKTGTKEMIASVLSQRFSVCKTEGNLNNEIGMPLTLLSIGPEHEVAVVEMGISNFGEMHRLGEIARPNIVVMTNIERCHLEFLHDRDGVLRAKSEVFDHLSENAAVILNTDDDKLASITEIPGAKIWRFGTKGQPIWASDIQSEGLFGLKASIHTGSDIWTVEIPLPGEHRIYHALAAVAVGLALKLSMEQIRKGIESASGVLGRTNFIQLKNGITIIDDCYNASPLSMKAGLKLLSHANTRRIAALGDMGELGEEERALHWEVGEYLADLNIDELYTAGVLAKEIAAAVEASDSSCVVHVFDTRDALEAALVCSIEPGSTILVKASHFMGFSKVVGTLVANIGRENGE